MTKKPLPLIIDAMDESDQLSHWFNGDADAIDFATSIGFISQIWDDLHDRDKPVPADTIDLMMFDALINMRRNVFFRRYETIFDTLLEQAIHTWQEANDLEARGELLHVAYSIRSAITPIYIRIAYLTHGAERGRQIAYEIRKAVFEDQPLDEYVNEVADGLSRRSQGQGNETRSGSGVAVRAGARPVETLQG